MTACRILSVAVLFATFTALAGCGAKPVATPADAVEPQPDPPQPAPKQPTPPAVTPPVPAPALAVPVSPADKARVETAEKLGAAVYDAQNGGYEVRIERDSDAAAVLAELKGTKCVVGLSLEGEKVTDAALEHLDGFDYLERLTLHACPNVRGSGFDVLPRLPRLKAVAVSECPITDAACAAVGRSATLEEVRLIATQVTDVGLRELSGLPALAALGLDRSPVTGSGFVAPGWAKLRSIDAPQSQFDDTGMTAVAALPALEYLNGDQCAVTDVGMVALAKSKRLTELSAAGNRVTDDGLAALAGLETLGTLNLSRTEITGRGFAQWPARRGLRKLTLDGSKFGDAGAQLLGRFADLTALSVTDCPLTEDGLKSLKNSTKLAKVELGGTKAGDDTARLLGALPALEVAVFDGTSLTDAGLRALVAAPRLRFVQARDTKVTKRGAAEAAKFGPPGLRIDAP